MSFFVINQHCLSVQLTFTCIFAWSLQHFIRIERKIFRFIEVPASNCNNACLEQLPASFCVWCSALCFWHVKFYHIWQNSTFCICFIMQKKKKEEATTKERRRRVYHGSDVIRKASPKSERWKWKKEKRKIFILPTEECFKCCCCVFNTWEIYFRVGLISVFPWIHITNATPSAHTRSCKKCWEEKMDFKMNNKHFHTQHRRAHHLKQGGLVCKIYVLSFNSPVHPYTMWQWNGMRKKIIAYMTITPNHYWLLSLS